ncbi:MAG TPA: RcnB family protein [Caulobacteraceae bacterium]|nr:RcnB family protein [Caulobacteraceae bacterium]
MREGGTPGRRAARLRWAGAGLAVLLLGGCATNPVDWIHGGETLMPIYRTPGHEIDYRQAGLAPPPMGFRWYRVDRDYVLANRTTGLILKSIPAPADPPSP